MQKSDVKRVWTLHEFLLNFRLSDASSDQLRSLLLRSTQTPNFVKSVDGVRFIVFLFTLSPGFVDQLHSAIKEALKPEEKYDTKVALHCDLRQCSAHMYCGFFRQMSSAYGEIYFKAWRQSSGAFRERVEDGCLQDLMYHGVMANRTAHGDVFSPIRSILVKFHVSKNDRQCQAMVCRLWGPILWRNLKVANAMVRVNAAELFFSAFPVEDPENELVEARETDTHRQFRAMESLLTDPVPEVRVVAVAGVCRTLAKFWLIVPLEVLNKFMSIMIRDLAYDASSPKVG